MNSPSDSTQTTLLQFFVTCPLNCTDLLATELQACGVSAWREMKAGVAFSGTLEMAYRVCLWSRVASRVLLVLAEVPADTADALYAGVSAIDWSQHLAPDATMAVDFQGRSTGIVHTQFGAIKTKDAIVDQFRTHTGVRPSVDTKHPDVRINVHLHRDQATIALDLAGDSLHRRGYRSRGVAAPLKENLAAAILLRAEWGLMAAAGAAFVDPLCGSGTLPIEAALIAADIAPGWLRTQNSIQQIRWGFAAWRGHQATVWQALLLEAEQRATLGLARCVQRQQFCWGYDQDDFAVRAALANSACAGVQDVVRIEQRALETLCHAVIGSGHGLLVTNPPYGERIGEQAQLTELYQLLGEKLRTEFIGWKAALITGNPPLAKALQLKARRSHTVFNGALECRLLRFLVTAEHFNTPESRPSTEQKLAQARQQPGAKMFANRLRKNFKDLRAWASKHTISCYRIYDADMPEYAFAIDLYSTIDSPDVYDAYVQEYAPPATVDRAAAHARRLQVLAVLPEVLALPNERIHLRVRRTQRGTSQYEKLATQQHYVAVSEGGYRFWVNFTDYLDTGLFLDHRLTRLKLAEWVHAMVPRPVRFLNLFAYTGTATVYAVGAGVHQSTTVDMSHTYLEWAQRNLALNTLLGPQHEYIQADCLQWLQIEATHQQRQYDLIFLDPPTFSRSKRMQHDFDVQRDHVRLLENALALLAPHGVLVFSNNFSRFKMDYAALHNVTVTDITATTIARDFQRNKRIHCCFLIRKLEDTQHVSKA